ncbi:MAG: bifunctional UDP-N-acetylglucosamine diphosphorylase/glucosamine-1-phosphate N-acetyltransferase GlmU [Anaerolineaceae bacterium]
MKIASIILAAGQSKRMVSDLPKVIHKLNGKALIQYSLAAVNGVISEKPVIVIGNGAELVQKEVGDQAVFAVQTERLGTAHAVLAAESSITKNADLVLVTSADMPLLTAETLAAVVAAQKSNSGPLTLLTVHSKNPRGFGRILRSSNGNVQAIVEEAQATAEQLKIDELNVGVYCFNNAWMWNALHQIKVSPKGEFYLTDIVEVAVKAGLRVQSVVMEDEDEALGVNNRIHLSEAERIVRRRINEKWMLAGVTMLDPNLVYIEEGVVIGKDTTLLPSTFLKGNTVIGERCRLGPNTTIESSQIGNEVEIGPALIEKAIVEDGANMTTFCHLRSGAHLGKGVHMGNFGEVKDSYLGAGTKMGHFSYIGNATIGENVNIGAGTITCNYDGVHKNPTVIGDNAFIGSDTMLVAPLKIGKNAQTGAGAVVTHDVAENETVAGVPARPMKKKEKSSG